MPVAALEKHELLELHLVDDFFGMSDCFTAWNYLGKRPMTYGNDQKYQENPPLVI
jgi:hypothetical protein